MLYFVCVVVAFFRVCIVGDFVSASDKLCTFLQKQKDKKLKTKKKTKMDTMVRIKTNICAMFQAVLVVVYVPLCIRLGRINILHTI